MNRLVIRSVSLVAICCCTGWTLEDKSVEIVEKLAAKNLTDRQVSALSDEILREPSSPAIISALKEVFERSITGASKKKIAETLIELNDPDTKYFEYFAVPAEAAIRNRASSFVAYDGNGRVISGQLNPEFENECTANHLDPREAAGKQFEGNS